GGRLMGIRPSEWIPCVEMSCSAIFREVGSFHAGRKQVFPVLGSAGACATSNIACRGPPDGRYIGVLLDAERPTGRLVAEVDGICAEGVGIGQHPIVGTHVRINDE